MTEILLATIATIGVLGTGGYAAWRTRKKTDSEALAALNPIIVDWLTRMEARIAAQDVEIASLRETRRALEAEVTELREAVDDLRQRLKRESKLRREYEALLIEHQIIEAGGQ